MFPPPDRLDDPQQQHGVDGLSFFSGFSLRCKGNLGCESNQTCDANEICVVNYIKLVFASGEIDRFTCDG
jgi:hypothetical protein